MSVLDDLLSDINNYPEGNVDISINAMPVASPIGEEPDTAINVGETRQYQVKVENNGTLDMKSLKLLIEGSKWADVSDEPDGPYDESFTSSEQDVEANSSATFGPFSLKATTKTNNGDKKLVRAHIKTYNAGLGHILNDRGHEAAVPEAALEKEVFPS